VSARALQGVGGAMAAPTALSLIAVTFPEGPPRNRAMGVWHGSISFSLGGQQVGGATCRPLRLMGRSRNFGGVSGST
jgi:MFS family permease